MSRRLTIAERRPADTAADALRALAVALAPHLRELLSMEHHDGELVDVVATVPAPKRTVMRACRAGEISDAVKVARRWLAPRSSVGAWLRSRGPRAVPSPNDGDDDELEPLRRSLARPTRSRARVRGGAK